MSDHGEDLWAIEQIKQLKARYFRLVDTKQWDAWGEVFTEDCVVEIGTGAAPIEGRAALVAFVRESLAPRVSVHHGHMPEITMTGLTSASGTWAMHDYVGSPEDGRGFEGDGHYDEDYVRGDDGQWRIARMTITRLRIVPID